MTTNLVQPYIDSQLSTKRILLANAKGGCGKTTIATNLASIYARRGYSSALIDCDPQASSSLWLKSRPEDMPAIVGIDAYKPGPSGTRNWQQRLSRDINRVIIDTPAALQGGELDDQIRHTDLIVVPVLPSAIDIRAATRFIGSILLSIEFRRRPKPVLVIANRVRHRTLAMAKLDKFLHSLNLPHLGTLRDTQHYVNCVELGLGVTDINSARYTQDQQRWQELQDNIEQHFHITAVPRCQIGA